MSENRFEIYKNYGVLGAEKRGVFTYGVPASTATCSDKFLVELSENKYFSLYYNTMDQLMVESSWGGHYTVNEVLYGNEKPCFIALENGKERMVYLKEVE